MEQVDIIAIGRSPIGAMQGQLSALSAHEIQQQVIRGVLERSNIPAEQIEQVIFGQVLTAGAGMNPARQAALGAGLPKTVPCALINQVCGSGLRSVQWARQMIATGEAELVIAGGQESMSNAPHCLPSSRTGKRMGPWELQDTMVYDGLWDVFNNYHMGVTAENLVEEFKISRQEQDEHAADSFQKAMAAQKEGRFAEEIVPIQVKPRRGDPITVDSDEGLAKEVTLEGLAKLKPAFKPDGSVTAGNSSKINDGAAVIVLASPSKSKSLGIKPLARIKAFSSSGVEPARMGIGPVPATRRCLELAGWSVADLDLAEANEAFSGQALAVARELDWDMAKVNVNGGAVALGHPIGASGARVLCTLVSEMCRRDVNKGLATLCVGGGMGVAMAIER